MLLEAAAARTAFHRNPPQRVHVVGNSCAGKSTFGAALAELLNADFVELDALNFLPGWVSLAETDAARLRQRMVNTTDGTRWVAAGSYMGDCQAAFWDKLDTVVWLDLPMHVLLRRMLRRAWQRERSEELLWGTNRERFWPHFALWRKQESLIWWIVTQHRAKRRAMLAYAHDPRWAQIRFVRIDATISPASLVQVFA